MADSKKIAFLTAAEGIERAELVEPWDAVTDAGHEAVLISPEQGKVQLFEHLDKADTRPVDVTVADADIDDYDALVLPGGVANPDALRMDQDAVSLSAGSSSPGSRSPRSATPHGLSSRPACSAAVGSPLGPACRPMSATRAVPGLTSRSWSTAT